MKVLDLDQIKRAVAEIDLLPAIEQGFRAYSEGLATVPPVGELLMEKGEVHIKYGCIRGDPYYVIKVASGFRGNPALGLSPNNGLMLLFSQETGALEAILLDEGYLTDRRTAVAGAIAAKYLSPSHVDRIGIVGTGVQARMQLQELKPIVDCRDVIVWGRSDARIEEYCRDMAVEGFSVAPTRDATEIGATCNLIVTTTAASEPILFADHIRPGTHVSSIGSDTPHKQELESAVLAKADVVVADSIEQCLLRGEIFKALEGNAIKQEDLVEIGHIIAGKVPGRTAEDQITVFDSTGVAVQDIQIATLAQGSSPVGPQR